MPQLDFPWEREAMRGEPMPNCIKTPSEQAAFQATAYLYARYNLERIKKDAASREKKLIKRTLEERKKSEAFEKKLTDYRIEVTRKTEIYRAAFRKATTPGKALEAARKLVEAIDDVPAPPKWSESYAKEKENQSAP